MGARKYIPTLDGWRALSVIGVVLYHGDSGFFTPGSLAARISSHGEVGVDVFFAISGFLICGLLLEEWRREGHISLRRFYLRRGFRILPPYLAVLAVTVVVAVLGVIPMNLRDIPSCLFFYRNYMPLGANRAGGFYTAHFWSLAVEEHFYLFWPSLLILVKPKRAGATAFAIALAVFGWRTLEAHFHLLAGLLPQANLMVRTDTRMDALLWGCLAAIYFPAIRRRAAGLRFSQLWLPVLAVWILVEMTHPPALTLLRAALLPALLLSTVIQPESLLSRILEWRVLRWLGAVSYSLYLWQELFLPEIGPEKARGAFGHLQQWPWNVLAILFCACLSRYLLEIPMIRIGRRWTAGGRGGVARMLSSSRTAA